MMGESPPDNSQDLMGLLQSTGLWRASSIDCGAEKHTPSGFDLLDTELPGGGWPVAGVSELLHDYQGIGEFRLLAPALANLSQHQARWLLLVSPPYIPYPPALLQAGISLSRVVITRPTSERDYLWVLEKALASRSCSAVIAWPDQFRRSALKNKQIRRLQVASKDGDSWGILFRPSKEAINPSPAELRLSVSPAPRFGDNSAINVRILKRRGGWESDDIIIHFEDELQRPMPDFSEMQIDPTLEQTGSEIIEATFPNTSEHRYQ